MDSVVHLGSIPSALCTDWKDDWFVWYTSLSDGEYTAREVSKEKNNVACIVDMA